MVALSESYFMTPEEYLEREAQSTIRHEYIDGKMYAVSGNVEIFRRTGDRQWSFESYSPDSQTFPLQSLDLNISFAELYEKTDIN
ncbi:hypothetical protein [Roseofilum casamattae]|uniref:Uma2 family endonuclease n=1 Tax=Roseofilum casamattae BLCC-M143 TaxID=3022442 RepID=A0ABT7BZ54_9CYAN|nr:hypothetical protein [Roseofilum casamattae]MDJ1183726.1 hypothetical protein [Roseofilum casamattae BLCC-M143]